MNSRSKPSDRLNPKTVDIFNKPRKSAFATAYHNGSIPCKIAHGSVNHKLHWSTPIENVSFDPVFILITEGLSETLHPYTFVSKQAFLELVNSDGAEEKLKPVLPRVVGALRSALTTKSRERFDATLDCLISLIEVAGPTMTPHIKSIIGPVSGGIMKFQLGDKITDCMHQIERRCGPNTTKIIKGKIPSYISILS